MRTTYIQGEQFDIYEDDKGVLEATCETWYARIYIKSAEKSKNGYHHYKNRMYHAFYELKGGPLKRVTKVNGAIKPYMKWHYCAIDAIYAAKVDMTQKRLKKKLTAMETPAIV